MYAYSHYGLALSVKLYVLPGAQIVLSMKIIGIAFDLSNGNLIEFPSIFAYFGYNFCVGTVIFGPWISFSEYKHILTQHKRPMVS